jgi:hypothetical protein
MKKTALKRGTSQMKRTGFTQSSRQRLTKRTTRPATGFKPKKAVKTKRAKKMLLKRTILEQYNLPSIPCSRWGTAKSPTRTDLLRGMLWTVYSKYIRKRDVGKPCITCAQRLDEGDIQAGHYAPVGDSPLSLWFMEENVNGEHPSCNADFNGWHLVPMRKNMVIKYGEDLVNTIDRIKESKMAVKWDEAQYVELIHKYLTA